jgi:hypothetical protein
MAKQGSFFYNNKIAAKQTLPSTDIPRLQQEEMLAQTACKLTKVIFTRKTPHSLLSFVRNTRPNWPSWKRTFATSSSSLRMCAAFIVPPRQNRLLAHAARLTIIK